MVRVFELAGEKVKLSVAQTLMQLIAEGSDDDDEGVFFAVTEECDMVYIYIHVKKKL